MNAPKYSPDPSSFSGGNESPSTIAGTAKEATARVGSAANEAATRVKETAGKVAAEKKEAIADRVGSYGSAIHESARSLEQQDPNIAWLTHRAAERLESVANYVRDRDFSGLRDDAERLARRHPVAFFGGMCVAGLVLGSVIRAARTSASDSSDSQEYSEPEYPDYMTEGRETVSSYGSPTQSSAPVPEI